MAWKRILFLWANAIVIVALGICYLELLKLFLAKGSAIISEPSSSLMKMALTGSTAALSMAIIFTFNAFITRQSMLRLGQCCGLIAFIWFYVVRAEGQSTIGLVFASFLFVYSAFAMLAFTVGPVALGYLLNKRRPVNGFLTLCCLGK